MGSAHRGIAQPGGPGSAGSLPHPAGRAGRPRLHRPHRVGYLRCAGAWRCCAGSTPTGCPTATPTPPPLPSGRCATRPAATSRRPPWRSQGTPRGARAWRRSPSPCTGRSIGRRRPSNSGGCRRVPRLVVVQPPLLAAGEVFRGGPVADDEAQPPCSASRRSGRSQAIPRAAIGVATPGRLVVVGGTVASLAEAPSDLYWIRGEASDGLDLHRPGDRLGQG